MSTPRDVTAWIGFGRVSDEPESGPPMTSGRLAKQRGIERASDAYFESTVDVRQRQRATHPEHKAQPEAATKPSVGQPKKV